jgi:hypothetical protein
MACNKCKKKQEMDIISRELEKTEKKIKIFFGVILVLALYGIYSLIF